VSIAPKMRPSTKTAAGTATSALAPAQVAMVHHVSTTPVAMTTSLSLPAAKPDAGLSNALAAEPARAKKPANAEEPLHEDPAPPPAVE